MQATGGATPLMYACQQCKENEVVEILRKQPYSVRDRDRTSKTPLHYCAENSNSNCAEVILKALPELVNAQDENGYCTLHLAVIAGNKPLIKLLIAKGADVNIHDYEGHSAVHWAIVSSEREALEMIIRAGANPSTPDIHGGYPLHYAVQMCGSGCDYARNFEDTVRVVETLLNFGVDVNVKDKDGRQPILWAASAGSADAVIHLISGGACVEAADKDGLTALHCAASRGHTTTLETLITLCGANVDVIDGNGCSALFYSVTLGHADATELLLHLGAEPNRQDRKGRTPAHCGAAKGQLETLRILQKHGGNLWMRNVRGDIPLHEAVASGRKDLVLWLLSQCPESINIANNDGRCPLHIASMYNNTEMVKVLLDSKSLVNPVMRTSKGVLMTPLNVALSRGHRSCGKYLQLHGGVPFSKVSQVESTSIRVSETIEKGKESGTPSQLDISKSRSTTDAPDNQETAKTETIDKKKVYRRRKRKKNPSSINTQDSDSDENELRTTEIRKNEKLTNKEGEEKTNNLKVQPNKRGSNQKKTEVTEEPTAIAKENRKTESKPLQRNKSFNETKNVSDLSPEDFPPLMQTIDHLDIVIMEPDVDGRKSETEKPMDAESSDLSGHVTEETKTEESGKNILETTALEENIKSEKVRETQKPNGKEETGRKSSGGKSSEGSTRKSTKSSKSSTEGSSKKKETKTSQKVQENGTRRETPSPKDSKTSRRITEGDSEKLNSHSGEKTKEDEKPKTEDELQNDIIKKNSEPVVEETKTKMEEEAKAKSVVEEKENEALIKTATEESNIKTAAEADETKVVVEETITKTIVKETKTKDLMKETKAEDIVEGDKTKEAVEEIITKTVVTETKDEGLAKEGKSKSKNIVEETTAKTSVEEEKSKDITEKSETKTAVEEDKTKDTAEKTKIVVEGGKSKDLKEKTKTESIMEETNTKTKTVVEEDNTKDTAEKTKIVVEGGKSKDITEETKTVEEDKTKVITEKTKTESIMEETKTKTAVEGDKTKDITEETENKTVVEEGKTKGDIIQKTTEETEAVNNSESKTPKKRSVTPENITHKTEEMKPSRTSPSREEEVKTKEKTPIKVEGKILKESSNPNVETPTVETPQNNNLDDLSEYVGKENIESNKEKFPEKRSLELEPPNEELEEGNSATKIEEGMNKINERNNFNEGEEEIQEMDEEPNDSLWSPKKRTDHRLHKPPRVSRLCRRSKDFKDDPRHISVTQLVQNTIRKYHMERGIFYQLLELKRYQIRSGRANEQVLVKRLADEYERSRIFLGMKPFSGVYKFREFEKFLYDQLKALNSRRSLVFPDVKSYDDIDALSGFLKKSRYKILNESPPSDLVCTCITQRCHHSACAYTSVPCSAYITDLHRHRHHRTKRESFFPRIDDMSSAKAETQRHRERPATLELIQGSEKHVITLPDNSPSARKRYYVTFTIKGGQDFKEEDFAQESKDYFKHRHAKSV